MKDIKLFKELRREIPKITERIFTTKLGELEKTKLLNENYILTPSICRILVIAHLANFTTSISLFKKIQNFSY
ncbi:winged helix-turn-helix transcriptional regulator [Candidatus Coxiella mudrowiae]|uniref:winged helix-turn-helix transcriptional regulator n=1 Tax=Candidatus Coxiella mudrowiae TaxID=2054173 RepID=UPI0012FEA972